MDLVHQQKTLYQLQNYDDLYHEQKKKKAYEDEEAMQRFVHQAKMANKTIKPTEQPGILLAPQLNHYFASGFVHCAVSRNVLQSPLRVSLAFQKHGAIDDKIAMVAIKQGGNRTSNYHIFDTGRLGGWSVKNSIDAVKLDKKAGNYIGKLRKEKNERNSYSLYNANEDKEQIAAYHYDTPSFAKQLTEGQPPRKMKVALPCIDKNGEIEPRASYLKNRMIDNIKSRSKTAINIFTTKEPTYDNGQYRLNFSGRVTTASVKNMQIINEEGEILLQFGKVNEHKFHLDFK